jgi:hypothetical protein
MSTILNSSWRISGVIDANNNVMENIDKLATASGCWTTFDINTGKWAVVINRPGSSIKSFDDTNIIGSISVSGTDLNELYNSVQVQYPHRSLLDQKDTIVYSINPANRFPNEQENTLNFNIDIVNEPVQIEALAIRELKQSRIDKVIQFRTDFTSLGLKAGDIIDVTASMYGFTAKKFRILSIAEEDNEDGTLVLSITAFEYDDAIYNTSDLIRENRTPINNIIDKNCNDDLKTKDDVNFGSQILKLLGANMLTGLINSAFTKNPLTGAVTQALSNSTIGQRTQDTFTDKTRSEFLKNLKVPLTVTGPASICEGSTLSLTIASTCNLCLFDTTNIEFDYTITGVQAADIGVPLTGKVKLGTFNIPIVDDAAAETETLVFTVEGVSRSVIINNRLAFTYITNASPTSITEGASSTVTLTTTGVADGTVVPYTITGAGTGRVTTALTGNVTVNSNTATLTVATVDDGVYQGGTQSVTVTFNSAQADPCGQLDKTASIAIADNDPAPPQPPADTTCSYVSVPVVWCGTFDGTDNQLKGVTVLKSMMLPKPLAGEATITVPMTLSVTKGNPSTIAVATTETIAAGSASMGGQAAQIITTFNSVVPKGLITGTTVTVYGY